MARFSLTSLEKIIDERGSVTDGSSYTATLISCGVEKCAQKLGEEAVEAVIAATVRDRGELVKESADVLYHLLVVLKASGIPLKEVFAELDRRTGQSGLEEKASRPASAAKPVARPAVARKGAKPVVLTKPVAAKKKGR